MKKVFAKLFFSLFVIIACTNTTLAQTIILEEGFEGGSLPTGWTVVDADGDGQNWIVTSGSTSHSGSYYVMSRSWSGDPLTPDNYLITPLVVGATSVKYYFAVNEYYPNEHYAVMASTTGKAIGDFQIIFEETATATNEWTERHINLPAGTKYVAFRHYNSTDQDYLRLDDITIFSGSYACPPVTNLTATVNTDNTVTLNWINPPTSTWPSECDGDIYFEFYNGTTKIGQNDNDDLTTWTTSVFPNGNHSLGVQISYWKNSNQNVCYADTVFKEVTITNSYDCLPITNLTAEINSDNTVTLNWTNPPESECPSTDIDYFFYDGATHIHSDYTDELTTWTTPELTIGDHSLGVKVGYYNNGYICYSEIIYVDITIEEEATCPPISDLTATVNINNTITLNWTNPPESTWPSECDGDLSFTFTGIYPNGNSWIGENDTNTLTTWTTPINMQGLHYLEVKINYYNSGTLICTSDIVGTEAFVEEEYCLPINNLHATVNGNNVSLTWDPPKTPILILSEDFESGMPSDWTLSDADGDGQNWHLNTSGGENSNNCVTSLSYDSSPLNPDNYLISPLLTDATKIHYSVRTHANITNSEHYAIMASTTGNNVSDFTIVFEEILESYSYWEKRIINLPEGTKYIAFRHYDSDNNQSVDIDNIRIYGNTTTTTKPHMYSISRNNIVITSGLTNTTYTDTSVATGEYNYCVKADYEGCSSEKVCTNATVTCAPITNLNAVINDNNITLNWDEPKAIPEIILTENFESGIPSDWTLSDANNDGHNWHLNTTGGYNSNNCITSLSFDPDNSEILTPDNYLITPLLDDATKVQFWVSVNTYSPYEHYAVMASTSGNDIADFTSVFEETMTNLETWFKRNINLPSGTKYIAFRHYNCSNQGGLQIDDVSIYGSMPTIEPHTYTITRNGEEIASELTELTYTDSELNFDTYNYCVQAVYEDCTSATACTNATIEDNYCLPITNLNATVNNNNVNLAWNAPEFAPEVLLSESFESGIPSEWILIDADDDGYKWTASNSYTAHSGNYVVASFSKRFGSALNPDNYLITPLVEGATSIKYYFTVLAANPAEHYALMASTTGTDVADFEIVFEETATGTPTGWIEREKELPEGTKYVAFRHYNCSDQGYILLDDITVYGIAGINCTYTITRDEVEIASGLTETTYTNTDLDFGTYNYCVKAVYPECAPQSICKDVIIEDLSTCQPVNNLNATINSNNSVYLSWNIPASIDWPNACTEDLAFKIYNGSTQIGYSDANNLNSWTTDILPNGIYTLKVVIFYYDNASNLLCSAEASTTITINTSFTCPPVNYLTATKNEDNSVTLNWTIPEELPIGCDGNLAFKFYNGDINIGYSNNNNLTSWTTPELSDGTHTLAVVIYYLDNTNIEICSNQAFTTVTIEDIICLPVENLSASINEDFSINLSWTLPEELPTSCNGNLDFKFYDGNTEIGSDNNDDLTSWTTPVLPSGTHTLTVVVYYYDDTNTEICSAEASTTILITNVEEIKTSLFSAEIYPNPAKDLITIKCDNEIISYELYDALGRLLINKSEVANNESIVNVSSLKHGMYMLKLNTTKGTGTFKIIKN